MGAGGGRERGAKRSWGQKFCFPYQPIFMPLVAKEESLTCKWRFTLVQIPFIFQFLQYITIKNVFVLFLYQNNFE
jgi:hypothetical protein